MMSKMSEERNGYGQQIMVPDRDCDELGHFVW